MKKVLAVLGIGIFSLISLNSYATNHKTTIENQCYNECMKNMSPLTPPQVAAAECRQKCGMSKNSVSSHSQWLYQGQ